MVESLRKIRVNISLTPAEAELLRSLAEKESMPVASKARDLLLTALELQEDIELASLAREREKDKDFISEEEFWG